MCLRRCESSCLELPEDAEKNPSVVFLVMQTMAECIASEKMSCGGQGELQLRNKDANKSARSHRQVSHFGSCQEQGTCVLLLERSDREAHYVCRQGIEDWMNYEN
jgi:hypothetical protein